MFREMRNKKRQLPNEYITNILTEGEYGTLATVGADGYPYPTPLNYVYTNNTIYFHCATEGQKLDNIKHNNKVSFCVIGKTKLLAKQFSTAYQSVIVFGRASDISEEEKRQALIAIIDKYSPDFKESGLKYIDNSFDETHVMKIEIEHATAKGRLEV